MKERGKIKRSLTHDPISFVEKAERRRIERLKNIKGTVKSGMKLSSDFIRKQVENRHRELQKNKKKTETNKNEACEFVFDKGLCQNTAKTKQGLKLTRIPDVEKDRRRNTDMTNNGKENVDHTSAQRSNSKNIIHNNTIPSKILMPKSTIAHDRVFIPAGKNTRVTVGQAKEKKEKIEKLLSRQVNSHKIKNSNEIKSFDAKFQRGANLDCLEKEKQEAIDLLNEIDKGFGCLSSKEEKDIPRLDLLTISSNQETANVYRPLILSGNSNREESDEISRDDESSFDEHRQNSHVQSIPFTLESFFPSNADE
jgi:hypothetical protein